MTSTLKTVSVSNPAGKFYLPRGTTAQRPGSPITGYARYNTTLQCTEVYNGSAWVALVPPTLTDNYANVQTSSGTHLVHKQGAHRIHTFTSGSHTFIPKKSGYIEVLVVAGGGSGGTGGGGGGAGGVLYSSAYQVTAGTSYAVSVGAGATGGNTSWGNDGTNGSNSVFDTLTAIGGGKGYHRNTLTNPIIEGGSGGGSAGGDNVVARAYSPGQLGTVGQGHKGGNSVCNNWTTGEDAGGGGGGAGGNGYDSRAPASSSAGDAQISSPGAGGPGLVFNISGTPTWYGGGGGGSNRYGQGAGGGIGGGGDGGAAPSPGEVNTGGGGGGTGYGGYNGGGGAYGYGQGGSGVVILRYFDYGPASVAAVYTSSANPNRSQPSGVTASASWTAPTGVNAVEVLVVAGGGGGGSTGTIQAGGGGGAGGLLYSGRYSVSAGSSYTVTIGAGGAGGSSGNNWDGSNGGDSTFSGITATGGGGGGGQQDRSGLTGGSGGGRASGGGGGGPGGGTTGQGYRGGYATNGGSSNSPPYNASGGGGAGGVGGDSLSSIDKAPDGGVGLPYAIAGGLRWYAGGGGAGQRNTNSPRGIGGGAGAGGMATGGGGHGGLVGAVAAVIATKGVNGTGGGGGGGGGVGGNIGSYYQQNGGWGGSGTVIIRWNP